MQIFYISEHRKPENKLEFKNTIKKKKSPRYNIDANIGNSFEAGKKPKII